MATYRVGIRDLAARFREIQGQRRARVVQAIRVTVLASGLRFVQEEVDATRPLPVDRGTYRRGWQGAELPTGATIYNSTPHAAVVEHGRRPGARMPPPGLIAAWARRKGLVRDVPGAGQAAAARSIGFVIARAIAERGLPGHHVLKRAIARLMPELRRAVAAAAGGP